MLGRGTHEWPCGQPAPTRETGESMGLRPQKGAEMLEYVIRRLRREDGQALVEYALILFLIAVVCIGVLTALGEGVSATLQSIVDAITP